jgi:DNA-binding transcriptional ArsR family regulator
MTELDEQTIFEILSHTTRRKILRMLFQGGYVNYSEFQEVIGQSPGVIYHHLEKLRDQGILQQRSTKEYELTTLGTNIVQYLDKIKDEDSQLSKKSIQKYFFLIPLTNIVKNNPFHWVVEAGLVLLLASLIQIDFPIQIMGPFLFPSSEPALSRFFFQILGYTIMFFVIEITAKILIPSKSTFIDLVLIRNFLIFPLLSSIFCFLLWGTSIILSPVPELLFWLTTILLHGLYTYFLVHLLIKVKKVSFEHSLIISLIQIYVFLIGFFLLA